MNIGEANAANVILRELINDESRAGTWSDDTIAAAVLLARGANKTLGAGLTAGQVHRLLSLT